MQWWCILNDISCSLNYYIKFYDIIQLYISPVSLVTYFDVMVTFIRRYIITFKILAVITHLLGLSHDIVEEGNLISTAAN